ncbi:anthranilate synthase component I [Halocalculus aciditolerans]|uniref:Anthranilate synthase component 1 n=1 Tax=Halocalculus aciditolerans TaxID=1383812 RepID=A0A830F8I7_9EURY|nr:anthranilate synthase component I [Halocalculus aciditolerans]GGL50460.1 anthranilate synthase component I [Halocalculus aciditolerans]
MSGLDCTREAFTERAAPDDGPVVAYATATLDVETTPLAAYAALADGDRAFLLESAPKTAASDPDGAFSPPTDGQERHARYSFVGYDPDAVVTVDAGDAGVERRRDSRAAEHVSVATGSTDGGDRDCLGLLRDALPDVERRGFPDSDRQAFTGGFVGFLAYDAVYDLHLAEVGVERPAETPTPDAEFVLNTRTVTFDAATAEVELVCTPVLAPGDDPGDVYDRLDAEAERVADVLADAADPATGGFTKHGEQTTPRDAYEESVEKAKEAVLDGEFYQGVVSRTREIEGDLDPLGLYESLRDVNPSPYMYVLRGPERSVVGASPETLVSVAGTRVLNNPIAGTCARGGSPVEDRRLAGEMLADEKERAEHTMLVDLARNDVRRVSEAGSVRVPEFMRVLKYSHVQHIESTVTGTLADDYDAFDAVRASFPAGTLSGAPKLRAMEYIDALEARPRGIYGGAVGYFSWTGDADLAIVIRTATVEHGRDYDTVRVRAGAGIVADSVPESEFEETEQKMGGVVDALDAITERDESADAPEVER